jgi:hypothetical protein
MVLASKDIFFRFVGSKMLGWMSSRYLKFSNKIVYNNPLKPTETRVTPFAEMANLAPRYGDLVPPLYHKELLK